MIMVKIMKCQREPFSQNMAFPRELFTLIE